MTDLIQAFFERDLNESEHEALSKLLEGSPDAVLRYESLLEQNYQATGLPQPTLPQSLKTLPQGGGWLSRVGWAKFAAVGMVVLGGVLWKFWPEPKAECPLPSPQVQTLQVPHPIVSGVKKPLLRRSLASEPVQDGQELSVVLDVPLKSLVTVRILDAEGREVRNLHAGFVDPGRRTFQWDGLLENGAPASAGFYRIDVQSGATRLSKGIQIKH
jgi:hypothetical protein